MTVKPDKKDWNAEKPAKQLQTASSIAKNKVLVVNCVKIFTLHTHNYSIANNKMLVVNCIKIITDTTFT